MSFFCHSTCCIPSNSQHCVGVATDAGWCLPLCSILQQDFLLLHLAAESYLRHWIHDHQSRKNWAMKQKLARAWSAEVVTQQIKTLACCSIIAIEEEAWRWGGSNWTRIVHTCCCVLCSAPPTLLSSPARSRSLGLLDSSFFRPGTSFLPFRGFVVRENGVTGCLHT